MIERWREENRERKTKNVREYAKTSQLKQIMK